MYSTNKDFNLNNSLTNWPLIWMISLFTVFHIITAATLGLGDDEAYYWQWSQHLAFSYYDHPPVISYIIAIGTALLGDNTLGIRFFNVVSMPLMSFLVYKITLCFYPEQRRANLAVLLFNILPVFFLGSLLMAPDIPMLCCYLIDLYLFIQVINKNKGSYWYLIGIVTGIGLLSKYIMVFTYLAIAIYLVFEPKMRRWLADYRPYLAFIISILFFIPVIVWNKEHDWASFYFQFYARHSHEMKINYISFLTFIAAQIIFASPVFFFAFVVIVIKNFFNSRIRLLLCFSLPPLLLFTFISLFTEAKPNWAVMCYTPLIILFVGSDYIKTKIFGIITTSILAAVVIIQAYYPLIRIEPLKNDITTDFYGWHDVAMAVDKFMQGKDDNWFVFSFTYQLTSQLGYALHNKYFIYSLADHMEEYYFWQNEAKLNGKNGLFVMNNVYTLDYQNKFNCSHWNLVQTVPVKRAGIKFRDVYLYECINFQGRK